MTIQAKWREQRKEIIYKNIDTIVHDNGAVILYRETKVVAVMPLDVYDYIMEV